jgi:hypothetical protein
MKNLILKELKLVIAPPVFVFCLLSALILIPSYPYIVGIFYFCFSIQIIFLTMRSNKDLEFTALLPISRGDIVKAKHFTVAFMEIAQLIIAVPFAILSSLVVNKGNPVGIDANFAFFGNALIAFSAYNIIFLPLYFKSGYKVGVPLLLGLFGFAVTEIILELLIAYVPALHNSLDGLDPKTFGWQLLDLAMGIIVFAVTLAVSFKASVKSFEKVNL